MDTSGLLFISLVWIVFLIIFLGSGRIYKLRYIKYRNRKIFKNQFQDSDLIYNEICNIKYSPAVLSYLIDQKIEPKKDILTTILSLYSKGAVDISKESNKYTFTKTDKEVYMSCSEKYLYETILENKKIDLEKWETIIREEYNKEGFDNTADEKTLKSEKRKIYFKFFALATLSSLTSIYALSRSNVLGVSILECISIISVFCFFAFCFAVLTCEHIGAINKDIFINEKGKNEIKKWLEFKNFIDQYTLIGERKIEDTILFDRYIPYAMALNLNKAYKDKKIKLIDIKDLSLYVLKSYNI